MVRALLIRFDAPLMSFGGVVVNAQGKTLPFPTLSMLTGLFGNALGYDHAHYTLLQGLQESLQYAVRCDRPGRLLTDFQTVGMTLPHNNQRRFWTSRGKRYVRGGGPKETHLRHKEYWSDAVYTVAVSMEEDGGVFLPSLKELGQALKKPARPLFIGRKCCLPSTPLFLRFATADSLLDALIQFPALGRNGDSPQDNLDVWWPGNDSVPKGQLYQLVTVNDQKDWANHVHTGRRLMAYGRVQIGGAS